MAKTEEIDPKMLVAHALTFAVMLFPPEAHAKRSMDMIRDGRMTHEVPLVHSLAGVADMYMRRALRLEEEAEVHRVAYRRMVATVATMVEAATGDKRSDGDPIQIIRDLRESYEQALRRADTLAQGAPVGPVRQWPKRCICNDGFGMNLSCPVHA